MSKMSKILKRPLPDYDRKGPTSAILASSSVASVSDDKSCLSPEKKVRLFRKLEGEDKDCQRVPCQSVDQSSKGVDVNENVFHEEEKDSVKQSFTRTSFISFLESKPRPIYPWTAEQTDVLKSAVESKSFQFLPRTTTDKIYKDLKKIFKKGNFERKDVFCWFLRQKATAQVSVYCLLKLHQGPGKEKEIIILNDFRFWIRKGRI